MGLPQHRPYVSLKDYLVGERDAPFRHEYIDGKVYAMAGSSDRHNTLSLNLAARLWQRVGDGPCQVFMSDMKIRAQVDPTIFYYPDVVVTCDETIEDNYYRTDPRLIVEVLSPSTKRIDRHEKWIAYRQIARLREYVLVSQDETLIEFRRRNSEREWETLFLEKPDDVLELNSVGLTLTLADVYRNVVLPPPEQSEAQPE